MAARDAPRELPAKASPVRRGGVRRFVGMLAGGAVAAVVIEWIGMVFWWPEEGAGHAARMLAIETGYLNRDFVEAAFVARPAETMAGARDWLWHWTMERTGAEAALGWVGDRSGLGEFVRAALTTLEVFAVRLTVLAFSLPVLAVFVVVGLATGLTMRDIRRWSAGREFGGVHHLVRRWPGRVLTLGCFAYLSLPFAIHPTAVVLPSAVLLGGVCALAAGTFKKYLT